jgi:hypothetical protein
MKIDPIARRTIRDYAQDATVGAGNFDGTSVTTMGSNQVTINTGCDTSKLLTVNSVNPASGVLIKVSRPDVSGRTNGTTPLARSYSNSVAVTLTAPDSAGGNRFRKWQKDGADATNNRTVTVVMDADHVLTAVFIAAEVLRG